MTEHNERLSRSVRHSLQMLTCYEHFWNLSCIQNVMLTSEVVLLTRHLPLFATIKTANNGTKKFKD
jgi:hypothetical protein